MQLLCALSTVSKSVFGPLRPFGDIGPVGHILFNRQSVSHILLGAGNASQWKVSLIFQLLSSAMFVAFFATFLLSFCCYVVNITFNQLLIENRDNIMSMPVDNKKAIIDYLSCVPKALCIEDIGDLFYLVEQHYVSRTPHTIKVYLFWIAYCLKFYCIA